MSDRAGGTGRAIGPMRARRAASRALAACALAGVLVVGAAPTRAFSVYSSVCGPSIHPCGSPGNPLDVRATLEETPRWSAAPLGGRGLHDGLQVGVAPGAAAAFGFAGAAGVAQFEALVRGAFAAWESPVLSFDVTFEARGVWADTGHAGYEIDFHAVPSGDPLFGSVGFFGVAYDDFADDPGRRLTNGAALPGTSIRGADVFIATDRIDAIAFLLGLTFQARADFLQRVLTHEIGHTLGLHHPNVDPGMNLDDDDDPLTRVTVDPLDPIAGLRVSTNVDRDAVMSNSPPSYEAGFFTVLRPDDLSGRDVLYPLPVPEPASGLLAAAGIAALSGLRRGRRGARLP